MFAAISGFAATRSPANAAAAPGAAAEQGNRLGIGSAHEGWRRRAAAGAA